jgi:hypothetical protein
VVKDSAAHCDAVFFPPIVLVVASGYFGYVDSMWLLLVLLDLLLVAVFTVTSDLVLRRVLNSVHFLASYHI